MNWSKSGAFVLVVGAVCLVSGAPPNPNPAHFEIPLASSPAGLVTAQKTFDTELQQGKTKQKPSSATRPGSDGIYLGGVKVYDESALEGLLAATQSNLAQLNGFDQTSLISHLGAIQGSTAAQSQSALQITGPQAATANGPAVPNSPTLPAPSSSYTLPSTFATSASDFLNEQMQLSMQMINLQLLLAGSFNDQFVQGSNISRIRTTLGFPINISVPRRFKYQGAVAEVEISVCAPQSSPPDFVSNSGVTLVTLLPQEKTYNVASLVSKASSIGGGAIAGVVNAGGGFLRSRQTYYLVQDTDTLALQRSPQYSCARIHSDGDPNTDSEPVTFAWQFRPVLGERVVRDGLRQTFAQISFPPDVDTNIKSPLRVLVRTGWRYYDAKTGRVGNAIDPFDQHLLLAPRYDIAPSPLNIQAKDNGDGTVTVLAKGAFKAGTRVRVGEVVQDSTVQGFEQNEHYIRFIASASSLALYGASLLNLDGTEADVVDPEIVLPGPPTILHIDSNLGGKGDVLPNVTITGNGTHFTQGPPSVTFSDPDITAGSITVKDDTHVSVTVAVAASALPGQSDVTIVTGPEIAVGKGLFTVQGGQPAAIVEPFNDSTSLVTLTLPPPPAIPYTPNELEIVLIGSHVFGLRDAPFYSKSDTQIKLLVTNDLIRTNRHIDWKRLFTTSSQTYQIPFPPPPPTGVSDFAITGVTLVSYTAGLSSPGSSGGSVSSTVTVSNDSGTAAGANLFTIGNGTPAIAEISVSSGQPGEQSRRVIITGVFTHFRQGATTVEFSNSRIIVRNLVVMNATHLGADLSVALGASKGSSNVTVRTRSETAIGTGVFNVGAATGLVTFVSPSSGDRAQTLNVSITGTNSHFVQGQSTVKFSNTGITASKVSVTDPTHLTVTLDIAPNAQPGPSSITVATGSDTSIGTDVFTVAPLAPSITSVSPAGGQQGQTLNGVVVTGNHTHFTQGTPAVVFSNPGITATNVNVIDDTHLVVTLNITNSAAAASTTATDTSGASQKPTNTYAISGSRLSSLHILVPAGVQVDDTGAPTLVTFSLTDDQAKAFKSIVVQHATDQPIVVTLPAPPASPSATPAKPSIKAQPATGIAIGTASLTVTGTGMSQVVSVRYQDAPLTFTASSDTSLTIQQLPTLVSPGIEVVFVYADKSMAPYFIPVQTPGPN